MIVSGNLNLFQELWCRLWYFIGNLYALVICWCSLDSENGQISIGLSLPLWPPFVFFSQPLSPNRPRNYQFFRLAQAMGRVFEFFLKRKWRRIPSRKDNWAIERSIVFDRVSFVIHQERTIIHDFSATAHAGQRLIVGPTGAGKTNHCQSFGKLLRDW